MDENTCTHCGMSASDKHTHDDHGHDAEHGDHHHHGADVAVCQMCGHQHGADGKCTCGCG